MPAGNTGSVRSVALVVLVCMGVVLALACAGRKQVKQGDKMVELGNYYGAAMKYLEALQVKPGHGKALAGLAMVATQAYEQQLYKAEGYKKQGNLEQALAQFQDLKTLLLGLEKHHAMNFVPADVDKEIAQLSSGAAEAHYLDGEHRFEEGLYPQAIEEYTTALSFVDPYKDCHPRISECYYRIAEGLLQKHAYRDAVDYYRKAVDEVPRIDAQERATEILYQLGRYFLSQGYCRDACREFIAAQEILPSYKDLSTRHAEAEQCAQVKIAFVRFDNPTGRDVAGMAIGEFIFDDIKAKVQAGATRFLRMLDRDELAVIMSEHKLGLSGLTEDSAEIGKLKGVDYLIFGKITQVNVEYDGLKKDRKVAEYTYTYKATYTDDEGEEQTRTESEKRTMNYSVNTDRIILSLSGSIKVIEVRTGEVKIFHRISEKESDQIEFASGFSIDIGAKDVKISSSIQKLAKARSKLVDQDTLAKKQIANIGNEMSRKILNTIDVTPSVRDPEVLPISLTGSGG